MRRSRAVGDATLLEAFDKSLGGRRSRDWSITAVRAPAVVAGRDSPRSRPQRPRRRGGARAGARSRRATGYRLDTLNVGVHSPLMRTLDHAHYTFRKKLSHTADSQDQRHRMVPGSRPLLSRTVPRAVDVVEPELIREDPGCHAVFRGGGRRRPSMRGRGCSTAASRPSTRSICFRTRSPFASKSPARCSTCCTSGPCARVSTRSARSGRRAWTRSEQVRAVHPS